MGTMVIRNLVLYKYGIFTMDANYGILKCITAK